MSLLANLIRILHILLIVFILVVPFTEHRLLNLLYIPVVFSIIVHWVLNSNVCFLTILECKLRNVEYTQSFINNLVSPVYNYNTDYLSYTLLAILTSVNILKIKKNFKLF